MGELVSVDITVENFQNILSFQFSVHWDETEMEYVGVENVDFPDAFLIGDLETDKGMWNFSWFNMNLTTISRDDDEVLMTLVFESLVDDPEDFSVRFSDTPVYREVSVKENNNTQIVDASFVDGDISYNGPVVNVVNVIDDDNGVGAGSIDIDMLYGVPPFTYEWSNGASTQDVSNLTPGTYTLTVTDDNNCTTVVEVVVDGIVSTRNLEDITSVEMAPNPVAGDFSTLYLSLNQAQDVQVSVFDLTGKRIYAEVHFGSEFALPIQTASLQTGLYLVQVQTNDDIHTLRLVKQ